MRDVILAETQATLAAHQTAYARGMAEQAAAIRAIFDKLAADAREARAEMLRDTMIEARPLRFA